MAFFDATSVRSLPDAGPAYNCRRRCRWRLSALAHERSGRARPSRFLVKAGLCPVRECRSSTGSCGRSRSVKFDAAGLRERTTWLTRRPQARDWRVVGNALDAATARETKRSLPRRVGCQMRISPICEVFTQSSSTRKTLHLKDHKLS